MDKNIVSIRIFDRCINFLGEVDNYTSLFYIRKWETFGEFEFHIENMNLDIIKKGNIIMLNNDKNKTGVIEHIEISQNSSQKVTVKGFSLSYMFVQRITVPPIGYAYHNFNDNIENIMIALVKSNAIDPFDNNRKIPNLIVETSKNRGEKLQFQTRYKNLSDELTKLAKTSGLGFTVDLDYKSKKFIFSVLEGKDLSFNQRVNPPAIFSVEYDNIINQNYIESDIGYKNVGYVAGQGEGAEREVHILSNDLAGLDRRETFIDARDIEEGMSLSDRGKLKLSETPKIVNFECEVDYKGYRDTWNLGDMITIVNKKLKVKVNNKVTEVKEVYEHSGYKVEPTFGNPIPLVNEKIKQITDTPIIEGIKGAEGNQGEQGIQGYSINYNWNESSLGIKREDETSFKYSDLRGSQGMQGVKGDTGLQGIQGLKGEKGEQGIPGIQGVQGVKGDKGEQGLKGDKGDTGATGSQGIQGLKGEKGDTGATGLQGITGSQGAQGPKGADGTQIITSSTRPSGQVNGRVWVQLI